MALDNPTAANALGTLGTICWCVQLLPQIWYNWRKKSTEGLPPLMMFLWAISGVPFGIYFILKKANIAVQVQPELFMFFSSISWAQTLYYPPVNWSLKKVLLIYTVTFSIGAGIMVGSIIPLRPVYDRGTTWPTLIYGIIASILIAVGLIPPYFELAKRNGRVVGINFLFLAIDTSGGVFSLLSLVFQAGEFDILGCVLYSLVVVLEAGLYTSQIIWLIRNRKKLNSQKYSHNKPIEFDNRPSSIEYSRPTNEKITNIDEKYPDDVDIDVDIDDVDLSDNISISNDNYISSSKSFKSLPPTSI